MKKKVANLESVKTNLAKQVLQNRSVTSICDTDLLLIFTNWSHVNLSSPSTTRLYPYVDKHALRISSRKLLKLKRHLSFQQAVLAFIS